MDEYIVCKLDKIIEKKGRKKTGMERERKIGGKERVMRREEEGRMKMNR